MNKSTRTPAAKRAKAAALALVLIDRPALENAASRAASLEVERERLALELTEKIAEIKEHYKKLIEECTTEYEGLVRGMHSYSVRHRVETFGEKKSIEVLGHKLAFRDSPGKVVIDKDTNEQEIIDTLLALPDEEFANLFLRYETKLNKEAILEKWDEEGHILKNLGITVSKPELFSYTPDIEKAKTSKTTTSTSAAA